MATAFSTPFWIVVAGVAVVAAGVSHLAQPQPDGVAHTSAQTLALIDRHSPALADVVVPDDDEARTPPRATAPVVRAPLSPFTIDPLGRLAVNDRTVGVLDQWIASVGHSQLDALAPRLRDELPPVAAERAWNLLHRHAAYRAAEREMLLQLKSASPTPRELLDKTMALRRRHFDSVSAQELFGMQEARALYAADVAAVFADKTLSEAQQAHRLFNLRANLPPMVAAQEFGGSSFSFALERQVADMRASGESDAEVVHLRRQFVDMPGVRSVIELEREQQEAQAQHWALRHPSFIRQRDALFAAEMSVTDKQQQLDALLQQHFKSNELADARRFAGI
ncbi:MAG: lipase secretion chaperone [Rhizobacter sp.]